ncbi:MAG: hypothetical protein GXP27_02385 [Planctomycetes bacterium]|nr:hypothetical protein [Planctomycetota bacterium]
MSERIRAVERAARYAGSIVHPRWRPSEFGPLEPLFAPNGLEAGSLVEWLSEGWGDGAMTLAFLLARRVLDEKGVLVVIDDRVAAQWGASSELSRGRWSFYAAGAARWELPLERLIVIRPERARDRLWALEQSLRCPAVAAVFARLERASSLVLRQLQLAAETGGTVGLLARPLSAQREPSWASVRLRVEARPSTADGFTRRLRVQRLSGRGVWDRLTIELEIDHVTGDVRLAAELFDPARASRAAGA